MYGICLLYATAYLLNYSKTSIQLQQDNMVYLHDYLNPPYALRCCFHELNITLLHDLCHGQTNNEQMYIHNMPMPIANNGL
jgi:hypothetical protein